MVQQNEKKAMKSADVCSGAGPVQSMVLLLRFCFPQYLQILLVLGCCAALSTSTTVTASPLVPTAQSGQVIYMIEVSVNVIGAKQDEEQIIDWLQPVFQNDLQTCSPTVFTTTSEPTISTSTVTVNTTILTTSETNTTNTGTTSHTTANVTTSIPITSTSADTTTPPNSTTTQTTTTAVSTTTLTFTTTLTTPTSIPSSTSASTVTPSTSASTVTTSTTASTVTPSTTASTVTPSTTASTVTPSTSASTITPSTTASTVTPSTTASTVTPSTTASTVTPSTTVSTVTPSTTASTVTPSTTASTVTPSTTASTVTPSTTASTVTPSTTASTVTPSTTASTPTKSTSAGTVTTRSPSTTASKTEETTSDRTTAFTSLSVTTATDANLPTSILVIPVTPPTTATNGKPTKNNNSNSGKNPRKAREIRNSVKTTGIFKEFEASCVDKTSIRKTTCIVTLTLKESVNPCCILRTLCTASKSSPSITVTGKRAERTGLLQPDATQCGNPLEDVCVYTGPTGSTCIESETVYSISTSNSTQCGTENKCNCSTFCSKTDAYYTFNITTENPLITETLLTSLLSAINTASDCPALSCPSPDIASKYKSNSIICSNNSPLTCTVVVVFTEEVPICDLSNLLVTLLHAQTINMTGQLTRAAICGNTVVNSGLHTLVDVNLTPGQFCTATKENLFNCQPAESVIVMLNERCHLATTTVTPNMTTTSQPNTTLSANETMTATTMLNATSNPVNETTTAGSSLEQANALLEMTKDASQLNSSQVAQLVSTLENLLSGPTVSLALGNVSVQIVSNLQSATLEALSSSANRIQGIADTVGLKLVVTETSTKSIDSTKSILSSQSILTPDLALAVQLADGTNFKETSFTITDPNTVQIGSSRARRAVREGPSVPQGSITLPPTLTENLSAEQQQMVSRIQFNFYQKSSLFQDKALGNKSLNSGILGASVSNITITDLEDDIIIYLRNIQPVPANQVATCVYWDFTLNEGSGGWNPKGCHVQNTTDNETICGCNHLTSFGILLDLSREPITSRIQATILTFITYIGCGISSIFLALTLLTYIAFGKLRKDTPSKILIHLCMALLLLNFVFLVDAWLALYPDAVGLCISTAWFLHYFLLVAFTWMGLEAVHMYIALVKVFNSHISHYMLKFSLAGWGIPMIVVIIVIAIDKDNYGLVSYGKFSDGTTDEFCWIKNDVAFYVAVVAYFCVVFLFNMVMFIVVLVQLRRLKKQNPHNLQHRTTLQDIRSVLGITLLLGLTWGFAFFAWGPLNLPFMYLFAIFNSLQGFFIFIFHCAVKENVRRQWRTYLCCGRMRLAENSEWSRTATQKTTKKSSVTGITSLQSSKSNNSSSSSSYLVSDSSDQMNGFGSPFSDRIITADEDPSMDVILNELNSQYRRL